MTPRYCPFLTTIPRCCPLLTRVATYRSSPHRTKEPQNPTATDAHHRNEKNERAPTRPAVAPREQKKGFHENSIRMEAPRCQQKVNHTVCVELAIIVPREHACQAHTLLFFAKACSCCIHGPCRISDDELSVSTNVDVFLDKNLVVSLGALVPPIGVLKSLGRENQKKKKYIYIYSSK